MANHIGLATCDDEARRWKTTPPQSPTGRDPHALALVQRLQWDALRGEFVEDLAGHDAVEGLGLVEECARLIDALEVRRMTVDVETERVAPAVQPVQPDARIRRGVAGNPAGDVGHDL